MKTLLAAFFLAALPAYAGSVRMLKDCADEEVCLVVVDDVKRLAEHNDEVMALNDILTAQVRELRKKLDAYDHPPECAKTQITEPSKNPAPKPPIPRERDS